MTLNEMTIIKMNTERQETWRYTGKLLAADEQSRLIEARFNRSDLPFHGIIFRENDRFIERYYTQRWYNIFAIHDRDTDRLKGWYCNVTTPAEFSPNQIAYIDLALDLLVYPEGNYLILDEDEFAALNLEPETNQLAQHALRELIQLVDSGQLAQELAF